MIREEVKYKVDEVLHDILCVGYNEITDDAVLSDDLGADSVDAVAIVADIEDALGVSMPDDVTYTDFKDWTVKDVYDAVEELTQ